MNLLMLLMFATPIQANSIGDLLSKVLQFFADVFDGLLSWLYDAFDGLFDFLYDLFVWIGDLLERLFQSLIDVLVSFFEVIYDLLRGLLYLLYMIGVLAVKLFQVIFELASLLWAFVQGFAQTLGSLFYTEQTTSGHGYSAMMGEVASNLEVLQLDVVAYILLFLIWIMTALGVMAVVGSLRN